MPVYQITYSTRNTYTPAIKEAMLEFLVLPATTNEQEVFDVDIQFYPPERYYWSKNLHGFEVLRCRLKNPVSEVQFKLTANVKRNEVNPFGFIPLSFEEERKILNSEEFSIDHYLFLGLEQYTKLPAGFEFPVLKDTESIFDFVKRVNLFVHGLIRYNAEITDPHRTLQETIDEKSGVCQDFAHLMLGILRTNKIPCRYISGYLNQGNGFVGTGAVHAWIQALIPGIGWIGFDPTNKLLEDHHYIKIAHGTDLSDCATLKGVIKGTETNQTDYQVLVVEQSKDANQ